MEYSRKGLFQGSVIVAVLILSRLSCYFIDKQYDYYRRPWAYSSDPNKPLLVGKWKGAFTDPDQIDHSVWIEIFEPTTAEERMKRFAHNRVHTDHSSPTYFEGLALMESQGRRDSFELWGGLKKRDGHELHFQMRPLKDKHPPGFNLNECRGNWNGDAIDLNLTYSWFRPDGSSFYNSADPRFSAEGKMVMGRVK